MFTPFPTSQRELLLSARGELTQTAFAKQLGVDRSCLSRYESEALGAPVVVLNYCLQKIAKGHSGHATPVAQALELVRRAAVALEQVSVTRPE
jgi:DNA-binding XRE family transcriptional regulator